jgi:hypothetical protein
VNCISSIEGGYLHFSRVDSYKDSPGSRGGRIWIVGHARDVSKGDSRLKDSGLKDSGFRRRRNDGRLGARGVPLGSPPWFSTVRIRRLEKRPVLLGFSLVVMSWRRGRDSQLLSGVPRKRQ